MEEVGRPDEYVRCTISSLNLSLQVKSAVETSYNCSATHNGQVIGFIIGSFFILEVLAMFIIIGFYFTHNFTGAYFSRLSGCPLTSPYSYG